MVLLSRSIQLLNSSNRSIPMMQGLDSFGTTRNTTWMIWSGSWMSAYICLFSLIAFPPIGSIRVTSFIGNDG